MIFLALLLQAGFGNPGNLYLPSPDQARIDRSFSMIRIDTALIEARPFLTLDRAGQCQMDAECEAVDRNGVRHVFRGANQNRRYLVAKTVRAADFMWKSIPALGIGQYRDKTMVMLQVAKETRGKPFDCQPSGGGESCRMALKPGYVTIDFDGDGKLVEASLIGYGAP